MPVSSLFILRNFAEQPVLNPPVKCFHVVLPFLFESGCIYSAIRLQEAINSRPCDTC